MVSLEIPLLSLTWGWLSFYQQFLYTENLKKTVWSKLRFYADFVKV